MAREYYAEEVFGGTKQQGNKVYTGPILLAWVGVMVGCFAMSAACSRSPNLSFKWLQRRVGCQFGAFSYFFTTNALYMHDGERWVTRDLDRLGKQAFGRLLWDIEKAKKRREAQLATAAAAAAAPAAAAAAAQAAQPQDS